MKILLFLSAALFAVSCSTTQEPSGDSWARLDFIVTSYLGSGSDSAKISTSAKAEFWGEGKHISPDLVTINQQALTKQSAGTFTIGASQFSDTTTTIRWSVRQYLGYDIDRELQLSKVLQFSDIRNGDTISASKGKTLEHTGSSMSNLIVSIQSVSQEAPTREVILHKRNDGKLELTPADLSTLPTHRTYSLYIVSRRSEHDLLQSTSINYSLQSEAIMEFVLVE